MKTKTDMDCDEFRATLERLGITQMDFSRVIGVGGRTVRNWTSGEFPVPKVVALFLHVVLEAGYDRDHLLLWR
jgi:DNA-binding transcriptional regulator YiaG